MENDLFDSLLNLEDNFYQEGHDLGISDGIQAGYTEGSVFAVEKGFEKFLEIGRLYGKALVWAQRLADSQNEPGSDDSTVQASGGGDGDGNGANGGDGGDGENGDLRVTLDPSICREMPALPRSSRLGKNLSTLLELVDPASLVMENTEDAVSDAEERFKGALIKAKLIQRVLGEREDPSDIHPDAKEVPVSGDGTGSIEDISALNIRH